MYTLLAMFPGFLATAGKLDWYEMVIIGAVLFCFVRGGK